MKWKGNWADTKERKDCHFYVVVKENMTEDLLLWNFEDELQDKCSMCGQPAARAPRCPRGSGPPFCSATSRCELTFLTGDKKGDCNAALLIIIQPHQWRPVHPGRCWPKGKNASRFQIVASSSSRTRSRHALLSSYWFLAITVISWTENMAVHEEDWSVTGKNHCWFTFKISFNPFMEPNLI